jgi:ubiquitin C-terminal hydrolase
LDLEALATKEERKKRAESNNYIPAVIKTDLSQVQSNGLAQDLKLKIKENLDFSLIELDKICTKGFTNESNCCFMNVCLQSLLSSPAFFNMLIAIGTNQEIMQELNK